MATLSSFPRGSASQSPSNGCKPRRESCLRVPTEARQSRFSRLSLGPQRLARIWSSESETPSRLKTTTAPSAASPLRAHTPHLSISLQHCASSESGAILDKKLAASVNILPKASSLYFWNGEIEEATEILLLIKTKTSKVRMLSSYVRLVHPFEIPEVFSLPMDQGDVHYLKWLEEGMEED